MRRAAALLASAWALALPAAPAITPFSSASAGAAPPSPWREVTLPRVPPARAELVEDGGAVVARIRAEGAATSLVHPLAADGSATPVLRWRWKVDRVVERADLARREGDDFAARVYVTFAVPEEALSLWERARTRLARVLYGQALPAAALCYVWDNRNAPGTTAWNAYTDQVRMVVLRRGEPGGWQAEARDIEADWRAAFAGRYPGPMPRVSGVAVSADTDQTGESVTAWFGDLRLEARR